MFRRLLQAGREFLGSGMPQQPTRSPAVARAALPADGPPVAPRVLMIVHDPPLASHGGRRLSQIFGWNDAGRLAQGYIDDLRTSSGGFVNYQIVERIDADWFPAKVDGFRYSGESYVQAWRNRSFHQPDQIDYPAQVAAFDLIGRYNRGEFDEVWFFAFPYSGDYESTMLGPGAFWCNSPPVAGTAGCRRRFVLMAFNYERGVDCMLENFGHRTESIMSRVYERLASGPNMWQLFCRYDQQVPGGAHCGNVHFAPSSQRDYDWGNPRPVQSYCDDWLSYPHLPGQARTVTAAEWGGGDMRLHHIWWFSHLPRVAGETNGVLNNWWRYILDPGLVP